MTDKTDREIMQQALYALEQDNPAGRSGTINALRERLAKPDPRNQCGETCERAKLCAVCLAQMGAQPEQEPVACIVKGCSNHRGEGRFIGALCSPCHTFITTGEGKYSQAYRNSEREWQGLTDKEIQTTWDSVMDGAVFTRREIYKAIEAKLKEKND